jgi:pyrroloquinoline quinone biosynthesis protein E
MKKIFRAEQGFIRCYMSDGRQVTYAGETLKALLKWVKEDVTKETILEYKTQGVLDDNDKSSIYRVLKECIVQKSPSYSLSLPEQLQIELTTKCSLKCPQCFCELEGQDINKEQLFSYLYQAAWVGIPRIALSGGEPLLYPWLEGTIGLIAKLGLYSALTTSGAGMTSGLLKRLKDAGLNELFFSLNGSTKAIHNVSRDAFDETIAAMILAQNENIPYKINWVAREDNVSDFEEVIKLAGRLSASELVILTLKPDRSDELSNQLSASSLKLLAKSFKSHNQEDIAVSIEGCFPSLYMEVIDDVIPFKIGCEAGRNVVSINVDGSLSPCRHIPLREGAQSLKQYWYESEDLGPLREAYKGLSGECKLCQWHEQCHPSRANGLKLHNDMYAGEKNCGGFRPKDKKMLETG